MTRLSKWLTKAHLGKVKHRSRLKIRSCISYQMELRVLKRNQNVTWSLIISWIPGLVYLLDFASDDKTLHGYNCHLEANIHIIMSPWKPGDPYIISSQYHLVHGISLYFIKYIIQWSITKVDPLPFIICMDIYMYKFL